jgi:hypothetical protein
MAKPWSAESAPLTRPPQEAAVSVAAGLPRHRVPALVFRSDLYVGSKTVRALGLWLTECRLPAAAHAARVRDHACCALLYMRGLRDSQQLSCARCEPLRGCTGGYSGRGGGGKAATDAQ